MSLIDAVLQPAPGERLVELELLNPYSDRMSLDDKLAILDIKARDERGRLFNLEMQMVSAAALPQRFLYYWGRLYCEQLHEGQDHHLLRPTISICFVNGRVYTGNGLPEHRRFRLVDVQDGQVYSDQLEIHVLELPNFHRELAELRSPLDLWLYFFKNGDRLDADALPAPLSTSRVVQAMGVLKMFSQDRMAREIYEGRLKARRDASDLRTEIAQGKAELDDTRAQLTEARKDLGETQSQLGEAQSQLGEAQSQLGEAQSQLGEARSQLDEVRSQRHQAQSELDAARNLAKQALIGQIQLCQRLLTRNTTPADELAEGDLPVLQSLADRLSHEVEEAS